jgi:hypothetical protein
MKRKTKKFWSLRYPIGVLIFLTVFIQACVIMIDENNFRGLTSTEAKYIKPLEDYSNKTLVENKKDLFLYEVSASELKLMIKNNKYSWIHLWRPYCTSQKCQNINYYTNIADKYKDLNFILVSESYDFQTIKKILIANNYTYYIYVLKDSIYGHKIIPAKKLFTDEITAGSNIKSNFLNDDFIFKDSNLIFATKELTEKICDSLLFNLK